MVEEIPGSPAKTGRRWKEEEAKRRGEARQREDGLPEALFSHLEN